MFHLIAASGAFEFVFGDVDTFNALPAVNGLRSLSLGLSYALFILGLSRLLTSTPKEAGGKLFLFVIALLALTLFPKLATSIYSVTGTVQDKAGINPDNIAKSMDRVATSTVEDAYETEGRGMTDVAGKVGDTISNLVVAIIASVLKGFAYLVSLLLELGYLLRDVVFAMALLLVPLALGFVVSPFGTEKGISLLFGAIGIALWPMGWLFIDAIVQLILAPLDSALAPPPGTQNGIGRTLAGFGGGIAVVVVLAMYFAKVLLIIFFGYLQTAIFIQRIMSGISGQAIRWNQAGQAGRNSAAIANVASGGAAKIATLGKGGGGGGLGGGARPRGGAGGSGGGQSSRFGGRNTPTTRRGSGGSFRSNRPSFS